MEITYLWPPWLSGSYHLRSCGTVAADCTAIDWRTGPLSRNATTKQWRRELNVHTVHLVFSTHFDVGCAWNVHDVMDLYFHRYIPQILAVQVRR